MAKRTRMTIETDWLLVIRGTKSFRAWCPQCGAEAEMIPLNEAAAISNLRSAGVAWVESPDLHHTKTADGTALICLNSILQRVWRTGKGESVVG